MLEEPESPPDGGHPAYREYAPLQDLAATVDCVWIREDPSGAAPRPESERVILPDNCSDILFELAPDGTDVVRAEVIGVMSSAHRVPAGVPARYVGIRFRPGAGAAALQVNAGQLRDQGIPLADVHSVLASELRDASRATSARDFALAVQRVLARRLGRSVTPAPRVSEALAHLTAAHGALEIGELSRRLRFSRQYLARLFDREVGLPPKTVARVLRMRRAMAIAESSGTPSWAGIACQTGYADQSHFVADFRALAGTTPARWFAERQVPDLL
jgi:AraC-like DNA-binding protein